MNLRRMDGARDHLHRVAFGSPHSNLYIRPALEQQAMPCEEQLLRERGRIAAVQIAQHLRDTPLGWGDAAGGGLQAELAAQG